VSLPTPRPGLVISYSYLWAAERRAGAEEGVKTRPCAIVAAHQIIGGREVVTVVPVTHAKPSNPTDAIEIPPPSKFISASTIRSRGLLSSRSTTSCGRGPTCGPFREQSRLPSNSECCRRAFSRTYATEFFKRIAIASWTASPVPNDNRKKPRIAAVHTRPAAYRHRCAPRGSGNGRRGLAARPGARAIEAA
jgi:hypothetical protein